MWITLKNYKRCVTQYEYDYRPACKYCGSKSICMCEDYQLYEFSVFKSNLNYDNPSIELIIFIPQKNVDCKLIHVSKLRFKKDNHES